MDSTTIIGILAPAITGLIAYFAAARRMSGQIKTTTAEQLWTEAHDIRTNLREQLVERDDRIEELEKQINTCNSSNSQLTIELRKVNESNAKLHRKVETLTKEVERLTNGGSHA